MRHLTETKIFCYFSDLLTEKRKINTKLHTYFIAAFISVIAVTIICKTFQYRLTNNRNHAGSDVYNLCYYYSVKCFSWKLQLLMALPLYLLTLFTNKYHTHTHTHKRARTYMSPILSPAASLPGPSLTAFYIHL